MVERASDENPVDRDNEFTTDHGVPVVLEVQR
jgi:hypothetical protein